MFGKKRKFIFQKWHFLFHKGISVKIPFGFLKKVWTDTEKIKPKLGILYKDYPVESLLPLSYYRDCELC